MIGSKKVLVTGTAGFIGFHAANRLVAEGYSVVGLDVINDYYDVNLKFDRLKESGIGDECHEYNRIVQSQKNDNYRFIRLGLEDKENLVKLFEQEKFDYVVNLAAQAGVRYSLVNPDAYITSNITGFLNILECCRHHQIKHLVYASSSSVYGMNEKQPFSVNDNVDHPLSLYAATKKSNELMAHNYSYLFGVPTTGLRFFSAYGTWGRPDMALYIFTKAIIEGKPIDVYNNGDMKRDFTYVADIVEGITKLIPKTPQPDQNWNGLQPNPATSIAPYRIFNIGNGKPVKLMDFIDEIEKNLGQEAQKNYMPMQDGDIPSSNSDIQQLFEYIGFSSSITIKEGVKNFIDWYLKYSHESKEKNTN